MRSCLLAGLAALIVAATFTPGAKAGELDGTKWRLVQIMSMDDSTDTPDDPRKYTLEFKGDGTAAIQADCNRGMGSWTSEGTSQLRFGPIASTRAMCPPGSLSEKYLAQFEWVRSYVMKEGHLYLATMADGSIIEFAPTEKGPPTASVSGKELWTDDATELQQQILARLFDHYASQHGIRAMPAEIDAFVENMRRGMAAEGLTAEEDLTPEEAAEAAAMRRRMAEGIIRQWKINEELHADYGGRIIYQQFSPEPLDAYRHFLEDRQRDGDFTIHDQALADSFWRYFTDETMHDFMEPGSADEARAFTIPLWEQ